MERYPGTEESVVRFPKGVTPRRDRIGLYIKNEDVAAMSRGPVEDFRLLYRDDSGIPHQPFAERAELVVADFDVDDPLLYLATTSSEGTPSGSSGAVGWSANPKLGRFIFGGHTGVIVARAHLSLITQEKLHETLLLFEKDEDAVEDVVLRSDCQGKGLVAPYVATGVSLGTVSKGVSLPRSNPISISPISKHLAAVGIYSTVLPTPARPFVPIKELERWKRTGVISPDTDIKASDEEVSPYLLTLAKRMINYADQPQRLLALVSISDLVPLPKNGRYYVPSYEDVVFGSQFLNLDPIDLTTSTGWPYNTYQDMKDRKKIFAVNNPGEHTTREVWNKKLLEDIEFIIENARQRKIALPVYADHMKMEKRSIKRVIAGENRTFFAGQLDSLVLDEALFSDLFRLIKNELRTTRCAVGINPHSPEWGELWKYITRHPNVMATDIGSFDIKQRYKVLRSIASEVKRALFSCEFDIAEPSLKSLTKDELVFLFWSRILVKIHAVHISQDKLIELWNQLDSGTFGTSQFGSMLADKMYLASLACWILETKTDTCGKSITAFANEHTSRANYSDDFIGSVSAYLAGLGWNQITYAYYMKMLFDIDITMPDKSPELTKFISAEQAEFLKRNFRREGGHVYAPLKKEVILSQLHWVNDKQTATASIVSNADSAMLDAVHHGREFYEQLSGHLVLAFNKARITWYPKPFELVDSTARGEKPLPAELAQKLGGGPW